MKRFFTGCLFVAVGTGAWWLLSTTAALSIKNWDGKFESVFRHNLHRMGLEDSDVVSSVHQIKKDGHGEWIYHQATLTLKDVAEKDELIREFKRAGADVAVKQVNQTTLLVIKKGSRIYQEIKLQSR